MFRKIGDALSRFMSGRYGTDSLNKALLIVTAVLIVLGWAGGKWLTPWMSVFSLLAYIPLIWSIVRMYSAARKCALDRLLQSREGPRQPLFQMPALPPDGARSAREGHDQYPLPEMRRTLPQKDLTTRRVCHGKPLSRPVDRSVEPL